MSVVPYVERTEVERLQYTRIEMEDVSMSAKVRDAVHAKTNHYIKESRPYFPNENLPTYIDCPYLLNLARVTFFASLFGALVVAGAFMVMLPLVLFAVCLLFFALYCQHERVNQKSLPIVLKQPVFEGQKRYRNAFYEVTVTDLDGIALRNYQAGVGFAKLSQGKIKFQAFNKEAIRNMSDARCHFRLTLFLFFAGAVFNCYFMVAYLGAES